MKCKKVKLTFGKLFKYCVAPFNLKKEKKRIKDWHFLHFLSHTHTRMRTLGTKNK